MFGLVCAVPTMQVGAHSESFAF
eukprot:COSAG02_NODE_30738_length_546_cov_0.827740_1_plen_22_part_10